MQKSLFYRQMESIYRQKKRYSVTSWHVHQIQYEGEVSLDTVYRGRVDV